MSYQEIIEELFTSVKQEKNIGSLATFIPELGNVDPGKFGIHLTQVDGLSYGIGDHEERFSIQSIIKVPSLALAYKLMGESLWTRLGYEPSGNPFNSLVQLENDHGIPKNPLINSGALVISDVLISKLNNPHEDFLEFVRKAAGNPSISYSPRIAESEKSASYRNTALCNFIKSFGNIRNNPEEVLDFYFNQCSIELSCRELSEAFFFLANYGLAPPDNDRMMTVSQVKRINAIMQTCGFYDESGEFAFKVGLPGKSGVGGGIVAIHPGQYSIAVWSPILNKKGNSYRGVKFLEQFTTRTELSIF